MGVATAGFLAEACRLTAFFTGFSAFATFFFAGVEAFLVESFLAALRGAVFCAFRTGGFEDVFAFGLAGLAFNVRPLTDDLVAGRRAGVREVERLNPFVMGLLMCGEAFKLKDANLSSRHA
ncbi:MAG: hypothetical protein M3447_00360 [Acidobacteriota bacterium]|nr:hypothetical protein [Acidobacteriota bacterium]